MPAAMAMHMHRASQCMDVRPMCGCATTCRCPFLRRLRLRRFILMTRLFRRRTVLLTPTATPTHARVGMHAHTQHMGARLPANRGPAEFQIAPTKRRQACRAMISKLRAFLL